MAAKKKATARVKKAAKKVTARKPAAKRAKALPIPKGYHIITPAIVVRGASEAIAFYKNAFSAKERSRMPMPDGRLMHAEIQIGDSRIMLSDEFPEMGAKSPQTLGGAPSSLLIYTKNVDALFEQAVKAGAKVTMPVADMFWGDRYGTVEDPFGHQWALATHKEDLSTREMNKRAAAMMSAPPQG
jgi:uncharacterized glyoxalase superfamily protein PhnB